MKVIFLRIVIVQTGVFVTMAVSKHSTHYLFQYSNINAFLQFKYWLLFLIIMDDAII